MKAKLGSQEIFQLLEKFMNSLETLSQRDNLRENPTTEENKGSLVVNSKTHPMP